MIVNGGRGSGSITNRPLASVVTVLGRPATDTCARAIGTPFGAMTRPVKAKTSVAAVNRQQAATRRLCRPGFRAVILERAAYHPCTHLSLARVLHDQGVHRTMTI